MNVKRKKQDIRKCYLLRNNSKKYYDISCKNYMKSHKKASNCTEFEKQAWFKLWLKEMKFITFDWNDDLQDDE